MAEIVILHRGPAADRAPQGAATVPPAAPAVGPAGCGGLAGNPFRVTSDLPAGAGVDIADAFCSVFRAELTELLFPTGKEKDHAVRPT